MSIKSNWAIEQPDISESEIPWYRWRWFFVLTLLVFVPVTVVIGLTGNIYGKQKGEIFKFSNRFKYIFLVIGCMLMVSNILRNF